MHSNVLLAVKGGRLAVTGSDEGETTVTVSVDVRDAVAGEALLLPKPITTFLATLPAPT